MKALKELRLTADDFDVRGIIGRGHFGEVMKDQATSIIPYIPTPMLTHVCYCVTSCFQVQVVTEKSTGDVFAMKVMRKAHILQQADVSVLAFRLCFMSFYTVFSLSLSLSYTRLPFSMKSVTSWLGLPVLGSPPSTMPFRTPPFSTWSWTFILGVTY